MDMNKILCAIQHTLNNTEMLDETGMFGGMVQRGDYEGLYCFIDHTSQEVMVGISNDTGTSVDWKFTGKFTF